MKRQLIVRTVLGLAAALLTAACMNPLEGLHRDPSAAKNAGPGAASTTISVHLPGAGVETSTILPDQQLATLVVTYHLQMSGPGGASVNHTAAANQFPLSFGALPTGTWSVVVDGLDQYGMSVARYSAQHTIWDTSYAILAELTSRQTGATAQLNYQLTWPQSAATLQAVYLYAAPYRASSDQWGSPLVPNSDYATGPIDVGGIVHTHLAVNLSRPSGMYYLVAQLELNGVAHPPIIEAVQLFDYQRSAKATTLPAGAFTSVPLVPQVAWVGQSGHDVLVSWVDSSTTEEGFRVYRTVDGGPRELIHITPPGQTNFFDGYAPAGVSILYEVRSVNRFGESIVGAFTNAITPVGWFGLLYPYHYGWVESEIVLEWASAVGAESYDVYLSTNANDVYYLQPYALVAQGLTEPWFSPLPEQLLPGTIYWTVVARGTAGAYRMASEIRSFEYASYLYYFESYLDVESTAIERPNSFAHAYSFELVETTTVDLYLWAEFDSYLILYAASAPTTGVSVWMDDDSGNGTDARLLVTLNPGVYSVEATSYGSGVNGSYELRSSVPLTRL